MWEQLWINSIFGAFLSSCTINNNDIVNWRLGGKRGSVYSFFMYKILCDYSKTCGLHRTWIDWDCPSEGIFSATNMFALTIEAIKTDRDLERYVHWELTRNYASLTANWLQMVKLNILGAAENNSTLAGLKIIYLDPSKERWSRHRTLYIHDTGEAMYTTPSTYIFDDFSRGKVVPRISMLAFLFRTTPRYDKTVTLDFGRFGWIAMGLVWNEWKPGQQGRSSSFLLLPTCLYTLRTACTVLTCIFLLQREHVLQLLSESSWTLRLEVVSVLAPLRLSIRQVRYLLVWTTNPAVPYHSQEHKDIAHPSKTHISPWPLVMALHLWVFPLLLLLFAWRIRGISELL